MIFTNLFCDRGKCSVGEVAVKRIKYDTSEEETVIEREITNMLKLDEENMKIIR